MANGKGQTAPRPAPGARPLQHASAQDGTMARPGQDHSHGGATASGSVTPHGVIEALALFFPLVRLRRALAFPQVSCLLG